MASYLPAIPVQSLVKVRGYEERGVGYVENAELYYVARPEYMQYDVKFWGYNPTAIKMTRADDQYNNPIRSLRFYEFLWYKDPQTGIRKIGKNRAWLLVFGQAVALACAWAALKYGGAMWAVVLASSFSVIVPVGALIGTFRNWMGRQW